MLRSSRVIVPVGLWVLRGRGCSMYRPRTMEHCRRRQVWQFGRSLAIVRSRIRTDVHLATRMEGHYCFQRHY